MTPDAHPSTGGPEAPATAGRRIPDPGFAGDDGSVPEDVAAALAAYERDPEGGYAAALATVVAARLLVPVVAVLGEVEEGQDGLAREKTSEMATVLLRGRDGRLALLAFTGTGPLRRWDPAARPVAVTARDACRAALHDGAAAVVVDLAGPVRFVVEEADVRALAEGYALVEVAGRHRWARADRPRSETAEGRGAGECAGTA